MKPLIVKDYREMYTAIKTGKSPEPEKPKEKVTRWNVQYGKQVLDYNLSYAVCVEKIKVYKRFGLIYKDKTKFKITPFKN